MIDILVSKKNESYLYIDCDDGISAELSEYFSFYVEGYKHMPKYKAGMWDGKIRLYDNRVGTLPAGLYDELVEFSGKYDYVIEIKSTQYGSPNDKDDASIEELQKFVISLKIHSKNQPLTIRNYQLESIYNCVHNQRQLSITPTAGGKSNILYCLYRWYLSKGKEHVMLVVPNLGLIKQMYNDFKDYSSHNEFDIDSTTQIIAEGASKEIKKSLVLCTWQSIYKMPSSWFKKVDVIMADEAHGYKAEAIKGIFEKATETKYRFGVTGSLDKSLTNKLVLTGLIGSVSKVKSTRDLIDEGHLSDVKIQCIILKYGKDSKKLITNCDYQKEVDFICLHEARNKFVRKLALAQKGVTLVLFTKVEKHGEPLYEQIKANSSGQEVHLVSGKVEADDRETIRKLVQESEGDHIIVGSTGTLSTGVNLPRINNIIFASPTKSVIKVMQSIGRGLRKNEGKTHLNLFDIADKINESKSKPNHTFRHFIERLRIYNDEEHPYKIYEVEIE